MRQRIVAVPVCDAAGWAGIADYLRPPHPKEQGWRVMMASTQLGGQRLRARSGSNSCLGPCELYLERVY